MIRPLAASIAAVLVTGVTALAFQPATATLRVSSGALYDYLVIGEHPRATEGFDNAYDTISPGNLNADMGEPFISVIIPRPELKAPFRELRGDLRAPARSHKWRLAIRSSLPQGTPLKLALKSDESALPAGVTLLVREEQGTRATDLRKGEYTLPAPGPGRSAILFVIVEQP